MIENLIEDAKRLSCVLKELLGEPSKDEKCNVALFEASEVGEDDTVDGHLYQITFIPPETKHPLKHIATGSKNGFFLLAKAILERDFNEDGEEEVRVSLVEVSRRRVERVLVGTPISEEVIFINDSELLHRGCSSSSSSRSSISKSQTCVYDWILNNTLALKPISLMKARYFISVFDYCLANGLLEGNSDVPFWVLVNEKNPRSVTYMATLPTSSPTSSPTERSQVKHVIMSCKGPYINPENIPSMSTMKKCHNSRGLGSIVENSSYAYALYELLGVLQSREVDEDQKSLAYVDFTWKDISSVLQCPPLTSDCVLHMQSFPGTLQLSSLSVYLEVSNLSSFVSLIAHPEQSWPELSSEDAQDVHSKIGKILERIDAEEANPTYIPPPDEESDASNTFSPLAHLSQQDFVPRKDLDFTENLWLILKEAVNIEDLVLSLQLALLAVLNGTCQPVMHSANKTTLAVFIRELLKCETSKERYKLKIKIEKMLDHKMALKCLVEIGIEKLLRDHTNYFLSEELVIQDQLSYYMDSNATLPEQVSRVSKLHNVLDLILTTKCAVNTGHTNLQLLTQAALLYYENNISSYHPVFSISIPAYGASSTLAVKTITSTRQPSVWCMALMSKSKTGKLTSIVQLSSESNVNKMPELNESEINDKEDSTSGGTLKNKIPYYMSVVQQTMVPLLPSRQ